MLWLSSNPQVRHDRGACIFDDDAIACSHANSFARYLFMSTCRRTMAWGTPGMPDAVVCTISLTLASIVEIPLSSRSTRTGNQWRGTLALPAQPQSTAPPFPTCEALIYALAPDHLGMILPHLLSCLNSDTGQNNMLNEAAHTGCCQGVARKRMRRGHL